MDEGIPEVGELSASSKAPILIPPPQPLSTPSPPYEVGVMRRSLGHQGVHPYHDAVFQSVPQQVAGQPFQQWLTIARAAHQFPIGDPLGVDISIPDGVELDAGVVGVEHQSGSGIVGTDVPVVTVPGSPPSVDSRVCELGGGTDDQPGVRSSPHHQVPCSQYASAESSVDWHGHSSTHSSSSFLPDRLPHSSPGFPARLQPVVILTNYYNSRDHYKHPFLNCNIHWPIATTWLNCNKL